MEGTEVLTLVAMVGDTSSMPVMITVNDNDVETTFGVSADPMSVMEGGTVKITAEVLTGMVRENS